MKHFDYAASSPLDEEAAQLYVQVATKIYGNSSSLHDSGSEASQLLEQCRQQFALLLGVPYNGIYFTGGGSEGNLLAIYALLSSPLKKGKHMIIGMAEHASIQNVAEKLKKEGYEVTQLPLSPTGHVDLKQLKSIIREETVLISLQHANPEIGTVQPIREIGEICKNHHILFHSDCVQSFGKVDIQCIIPYVDSITISGHKFYGPKGVGVVYINPFLHWQSFIPHTTHEGGLKPGTVDVPAIAAMTFSAKKSIEKLNNYHTRSSNIRKIFLQVIVEEESRIIPYHADLPSIIGLRMRGVEGQLVMLECNRHGFAISTGSACQVGMQEPSKTMKAIGITGQAAKEFVRISFGRDTTEEEACQLGKTLVNISRGIAG